MRRLMMITWVAAAAMMAACGGNGLVGSPTNNGGGSSVATVTVASSAAQIAADGSSSATINATAKDKNNNLVPNVAISFSSSGGGLAVTQATTDANGLATATLTAGGAAVGTVITVTAATGGISGKTTVTVANTQQTISVITSAPQIPSDGTKPATITALVRNSQNQFVSGVAVTFTSTSGGLTVTRGTTDVNGSAVATLSPAGDPTDRTITVSASAGSTPPATVPVAVVGTKLTLSGPASLVLNSQGTYTVAVVDAGGNGIANQAVTLASKNGNTLSATTITTDATGQKTFSLTAAAGGADTLTATALGLTATQAIAVSTQSFALSAPATAAVLNIGTSYPVTATWSAAGVAQTGQTVTFSATRGSLSSSTAVVSAAGTATVNVSSTTAGPSVISASGTGVTAQVDVDFVATTPTAVSVQASPSTIVAQGQSTITATVRDANNNLVAGKVVNFAITQDSTGGSLSVASATTNAQGQASTVYTASTTTSATDGIIVSATVAGTTVPAGTADLTVAGATVFLSLGTGNTISPLNSTQYEMPFTVQAIDAAGNGVNNVTINFSVISLGYQKGRQSYLTPPGAWTAVSSTIHSDQYDYTLAGLDGCRTEDVNGNGVLDPGEDYNTNGKLDPGLVASTDVASQITANGGTAAVNVIYPKDHAQWVAIRLTATATVTGTQSSTSTDFWLPVLSGDVSTQSNSPPGLTSPYGIGTTCGSPN